MDRSAYASLSAQEGSHWWFVARRAIVDALIRTRIAPRADARILEAGCGTGGNLAMLARHGTVDALEYDGESLALAMSRGVGTVAVGALPDQIGFGDNCYDLIVLLDVLEHVEQDRASLAALRERLAVGGSLLLTVPAAPWLWSDHDILHHHKRRYTLGSLSAVARSAGLQVKEVGYFNSLLFPVAVLARFAQRLTGRTTVADSRPLRPINALFRHIFCMERHLIGDRAPRRGVGSLAVVTATSG